MGASRHVASVEEDKRCSRMCSCEQQVVVASDRGTEVINIWTRTITKGGEFAKKRQ